MSRASSPRSESSGGITPHTDAAPSSTTTSSKDVEAEQQQEPAPQGLTCFDVASFMINRMIGTGIFTNPPFVLWACGNQHLALWVWFAGGLFSLACFYVYVEYGMAWPHNGGDVLYIDQIFSRRLRYLPVLAYSFFFLLVGTSYTNSYGFAKNFLTGFSPTTKDPYELNQHAVKVTAVIVITVVSLVLYRDKTLALRLNRLFAVYKVLLISIGCITAFTYSVEGISWSYPAKGWRTATGFFAVLYAYQGWEIPFYVLGELDGHARKRTLTQGGIAAIALVTVLYMLANVAVMVVLPYETLVNSEGIPAMTVNPKATAAVAFLISLSPLGNMLAKTYAYGYVGKVIGDQKLIPLWKILSRQSNFKHPTNSGAYLVHWVACVVGIIAIATPHYNSHAFSIGTTIYSYGRMLVVTIIAVALPWGAVQTQHRYRWWIIAALLAIVNIGALVMTAILIAPSDSNLWIRPIAAFALMGTGILWGLFLCLLDTPGTAVTTPVQKVLGVRMEITPCDNSGLTRTVAYFQVGTNGLLTRIGEFRVLALVPRVLGGPRRAPPLEPCAHNHEMGVVQGSLRTSSAGQQ